MGFYVCPLFIQGKLMKHIFTLLFSFIAFSITVEAMPIIPIAVNPQIVYAGQSLIITPEQGNTFGTDSWARIKVFFDADTMKRVNVTRQSVTVLIPSNANPGNHTIKITVDDGPEGSTSITIINKSTSDNAKPDGMDPNPETQYGDPIEAGKNPKGKPRGQVVVNPSGGYGNIPEVACDSLHKVDGKFTENIVPGRTEWLGIIPQNGRFSDLYIDFCSKTNTLYLLNDWYLASEKPDSSSCYNLFKFSTGNGAEQWEIRVYHDKAKGTKVIRNEVDVSKDTAYIIGGAFGFEKSPIHREAHTIYEFAIRVKEGAFFMPVLCDPVRPTDAVTICDDNGYGLVKDPSYFYGSLNEKGITLYKDPRYIPLSGVAGLPTEPNIFGGVLNDSNAVLRKQGSASAAIQCISDHVVDGNFTALPNNKTEWELAIPAIGKYSNLYADFCKGWLHILNDWKLGTEEPDKENCYNLFELYTGNGTQHWGIYVYHSLTKGIKVFLNGTDVSNDTSIVKGGKFGFDKSSLAPYPHTIYEFAIKAEDGPWHLMMCDPGPSSFCDNSNENIPRSMNDSGIGIGLLNESSIEKEITTTLFDTLAYTVRTVSNSINWGGSRYKVIFNYDQSMFRPIRAMLPQTKTIGSSPKIIGSPIYEPGRVIVNVECKGGFSGTGDLVTLEGQMLFGWDSTTYISGEIQIGNSAEYMRKAQIQSCKLIASRPILYGNSDAIKANLTATSNATGDILHLAFTMLRTEKANIKVYDEAGNVLYTHPETIYTAGEHSLTMNIGNHQKGAHYLMITSPSGSVTVPYVNKE